MDLPVAFPAYEDSHIKNEIVQFSSHLTSKSMNPFIQTLIDLKAKVSKNDELEYQDMSILIILSPLKANRNSNSDEKNKLHDIQKRIVHLN